MKSSIHLFYGIIIGILLVACTGSIKQDKAEFKEEKVFNCSFEGTRINDKIAELKKEGWTILDVEGHGETIGLGNKLTLNETVHSWGVRTQVARASSGNRMISRRPGASAHLGLRWERTARVVVYRTKGSGGQPRPGTD